jgi:hypothetical protein
MEVRHRPVATVAPGLCQTHEMIVKLSKELEGYGVGVLGKCDVFGAGLLPSPS